MADEAIIRAEYVEWKMVKTRKALQLVFEVPLEHQAMVQNALGTPMPDLSCQVAIARLRPSSAPQIEHANDEQPRRNLSQVAAILCNKVPFRRFLTEERGASGGLTADDAAEWVRACCGVASRKDLNDNPTAAAKFRDLSSAYDAWMKVPV